MITAYIIRASRFPGITISDDDLVAKARAFAKQLVPGSYNVEQLTARVLHETHARQVSFAGRQEGCRIPPSLSMRLTDDGKGVISFTAGEEPIPNLTIGDVRLSAEEACNMAVSEALRRMSATTGLTETELQERGAYAPEETPGLYYSNNPKGYMKLPTPGAFYNINIIRTKHPEAGSSDGLPESEGVVLDANTGQMSSPPPIAGIRPVTLRTAFL